MENPLKETKAEMLQGELADFKFNECMKNKVLEAIETRSTGSNQKKTSYFKRAIPIMFSAALIALFFGGIYEYVVKPNLDSRDGQGNARTDEIPREKKADNENPIGVDDSAENTEIEQITEAPKEEVQTQVETGLESPAESSVITEQPAIIPPDVPALLTEFNQKAEALFKSPTDENFRFINIKSKVDFFNQFTGLATKEVMEKFTDHHLEEKSDGLYLTPTDGGRIFLHEYPYEIQKSSDTEYMMSQSVQDGIYNFSRTVTVEYINGKWIITDI